jgi:heme-degrading monooxygenase HmoA
VVDDRLDLDREKATAARSLAIAAHSWSGQRWEPDMMTVITTTRLKPGADQEWDAAIGERFQSARERPGWICGQLLTPLEALDARVIVGTWRAKDDWKAWHQDPAFAGQRSRLEELEAVPSTTAWYTVVADGQANLH